MTVQQYEDRLLEGDRWIELVAGRLIRLDPPDELHGDVVRNLSLPLAKYLKSRFGVQQSRASNQEIDLHRPTT
jgi:hypothetical protein